MSGRYCNPHDREKKRKGQFCFFIFLLWLLFQESTRRNEYANQNQKENWNLYFPLCSGFSVACWRFFKRNLKRYSAFLICEFLPTLFFFLPFPVFQNVLKTNLHHCWVIHQEVYKPVDMFRRRKSWSLTNILPLVSHNVHKILSL